MLSGSAPAQQAGLDWLRGSSLEERGQILRQLLGDAGLAASAAYDQALFEAASARSVSSVERLAARLLLTLVDAKGGKGRDSKAGASMGLLVIAQAMGLSVAEVVAGAVQLDVPTLSIDEQA